MKSAFGLGAGGACCIEEEELRTEELDTFCVTELLDATELLLIDIDEDEAFCMLELLDLSELLPPALDEDEAFCVLELLPPPPAKFEDEDEVFCVLELLPPPTDEDDAGCSVPEELCSCVPPPLDEDESTCPEATEDEENEEDKEDEKDEEVPCPCPLDEDEFSFPVPVPGPGSGSTEGIWLLQANKINARAAATGRRIFRFTKRFINTSG